MTEPSELRVTCIARPTAAKTLRHALAAFLHALAVDPDSANDILTAVGEALANAVEHAYPNEGKPGNVELAARVGQDGRLVVSVTDGGSFVQRALRPDRGFGLRIARAIARSVALETENGTRVRMVFEASSRSVAT